MQNNDLPSINTTEFFIKLNKSYFEIGDWLQTIDCKMIILEKPYKSKLNKFFQFISFGLYKAPWQYKVKLIK